MTPTSETILWCFYCSFWSLMVIIFCHCIEKGCLNNQLNFSFCAPQKKKKKCPEQRVHIHLTTSLGCGSSEMFFRWWQMMTSSTEAEWWAMVGLSLSWGTINMPQKNDSVKQLVWGLSFRQWIGTNLCTYVGSVLFLDNICGRCAIKRLNFYSYVNCKPHSRTLRLCVVIPQAVSFKATETVGNRLICF